MTDIQKKSVVGSRKVRAESRPLDLAPSGLSTILTKPEPSGSIRKLVFLMAATPIAAPSAMLPGTGGTGWYGSGTARNLTKSPSLLVWDGGTAPGGYTPLPRRSLLAKAGPPPSSPSSSSSPAAPKLLSEGGSRRLPTQPVEDQGSSAILSHPQGFFSYGRHPLPAQYSRFKPF